jgi:salicylate biosynthesis isochorismate synthase/menaquinone-specific isochorismate synthase
VERIASARVELLAAARARARRLGTPVVVAGAEPRLAERAEGSRALQGRDPLALYARAEELGEARNAWTCGASGVTRIGVGEVAVLRAPGSGPEAGPEIAEVAARARELLRGAELGPGADLLLLGGFAFEPRPDPARDPAWRELGAGRLVLPEWTLVATPDGTRLSWAARVAPDDDPVALARAIEARRTRLLAPPCGRADAPRLGTPASALSARYTPVARALVDAIRSGAAQKVVLAASESLPVQGHLDAARALRALRAAHPTCLCFALGLGHATFLGATPERMVELAGGRVSASALAGTAPLGCDLQGSAKDRAEHAFVVEAIAAALRATCDDVEVPAEPALRCTGRVAHLETELRGRARPGVDLLDLVERLHPTPAVAGTPRAAALELIRKHEAFDRGWYAGPIGWVDARGEGEFHVALRCGLLLPGELRAFAGAGLVAASDPQLEAAETLLKLEALREPLERACAS